MATVEVGNGAVLSAADQVEPQRSLWRGPRFITEVFDGADDALAALEAVQGGLISTGFQTLNWLTVLYEELAPAQHAMPRLVVVTERNTGEIALVLPLLVRKKRTLRVARFADLGVSDYGGPILGPALIKKSRSSRRVWRAIRHAMRDVDLIKLERMPAEIGGRANPLMTRFGITPARHSGNLLIVPDTVEAYLRGRGKKYRKEVERCGRVWEKEGVQRFYRATTPEGIARVYSMLEEQQSDRHAQLGSKYILDEPAYRAFYERLAMDGSEADLAALFALESKGEIVATLFGIVHDGAFTLLRISTAGEASGHFSPGRLIIVEAMKYFVARGVRHFDMGIGDHPFKRGFGTEEVPLYDLIVARDLAAQPRAVFHRLKGRLRKNKHVRAVFSRLRAAIGR
jgi:CelD/BcsL family acetyltransferase involved in cellulose biosynthesis